MNRLTIGKEGDIVSAHAADDWLESGFQRSQGLEPDGIVGRKTAAALNTAVAEFRN